MKIGLVSAKKHCKSHMQALQADGYDISLLGARPKSIPSSYDAIIVRVASISHEGEATAREWMRQTGKPAIYENGLSGIRRELKRITEGAEEDTPVTEESKQKVRSTLQMCADTYVEHRPKDGPDDLTKALNALLHENYPDQAQQLASMVPSIVASIFPYTTHTEPDQSMPDNTPTFAHSGTTANWPTDKAWANVYTESKARAAYTEGTGLIKNANHMAVTALKHSLESGTVSRRVKATWADLLAGKPLTAAFVMVMLHPEITKARLLAVYKAITGKGGDSRLLDVVQHSIGGGVYEQEAESTASEPVLLGNAHAIAESNTQAILEVMEDLTAFKGEIKANCDPLRKRSRECFRRTDRLESKLDEAIKAGFDPRTDLKLSQMEKRIGDLFATQLQNHKHEINRTLGRWRTALGSETPMDREGADEWKERFESRIKDLEGCWDALNGQVPTLIGQAAGAVEHRLRGEVSDTFDTLSAQWSATDDVSASPLAALERIKAALKAAGFKGTLTLTIE